LAGCPKSGDAAQAQLAESDPLAAASQAKAAGKPDEAIGYCRRALAKSPRSLDAWRLLVQLHAESGRLGELTRELQAKGAAAPNDDTLHYALGLAYFAQARTAGDQALTEFQQAEKLEPSQPEYPFRLGVAYLELERYGEALPALQRAVQGAPQNAKFRVPLGLTLARLQQRAAALEQFRALLDLSPSGRDVKLAQQALERLNDPLRGVPQAEVDNVKRGLDWLHQADQPQQAIETFQDVLDRFPDLAAVHVLVGLAYERLDDAGPAVEHFQRAIELDPDDAQPYLYLGELYFGKQKPEKAVELYRKALERNPLLDRAYGRLGEIALTQGDGQTALVQFKRLVVLTPDDADAHKALAQAYELSGNIDGAESELRGIVTRQPKDLDGQLRLGLLYASLAKKASSGPERERRSKQAQDAFQKVLDVQPENVAASRAILELRASGS
jgi:tetratricopeptide (TPR) repeat protein